LHCQEECWLINRCELKCIGVVIVGGIEQAFVEMGSAVIVRYSLPRTVVVVGHGINDFVAFFELLLVWDWIHISGCQQLTPATYPTAFASSGCLPTGPPMPGRYRQGIRRRGGRRFQRCCAGRL